MREEESTTGSCGRCGRRFPSETPTDTELSGPISISATPTVARTPRLPTAKLVVLHGNRLHVEYPLRPGANVLGRAAIPDVDIDLADQETPDLALASRRHAVIYVDADTITVEDLSSLNGVLVNRTKIRPRTVTPLESGDVLQIGTVLFKIVT